MKLWQSDEQLFELVRTELFTAVVGDVMDTLGLQHQFLPPYIRPLRNDMMVVGRAMPAVEADIVGGDLESSNNLLLNRAFGLMFHALDDLKPGEVYICSGASPRYALWGELMSTRARQLGAVGAVVDGYYRDTRAIECINFPTFGRGGYAQDQGPRGKVIDFRVPIKLGEVVIQPGDLVLGDLDGVCIVPRAAEDDAIRGALEKVRGEKLVLKALKAGMSTVEAWDKFGIM
jgi:regulator of RNase E activity RraA